MGNLISDLHDRGLIHNCSDMGAMIDLDQSNEKFSVYAGFDCTADSLHVGSLITLTMLKRFQDAGHRVIVVLGTGTSLVGDPSGKDSARPLMTTEQIESNRDGILKSIKMVLADGFHAFDNSNWLASMNFIDVLRIFGRHISVNRMLSMDSVKSRLEKDSLSFLEFSYSLLQAHDFFTLATMLDTEGKLMFPNLIQIGGSDQWGNICAGLELIRKLSDVGTCFALTHPLLLNSDGTKMGKTAKGAVWLNEDKLTNFDFWQFWRNVKDEQLREFMLKFTDVFISFDIGETGRKINDQKIFLANFITGMVRGHAAARACESAAIEAFEKGGVSDQLNTVTVMATDMMTTRWVDICVRGGLCPSKSDAHRLMQQNGITLNGKNLVETDIVSSVDFDDNGAAKIMKGKKNILIVKIE